MCGFGLLLAARPSLKAAIMPIVGIVLTQGTFERTGISCSTFRDVQVRKSFAANLDLRLVEPKGRQKKTGEEGSKGKRKLEVSLRRELIERQ